jgi:hypothetical protein
MGRVGWQATRSQDDVHSRDGFLPGFLRWQARFSFCFSVVQLFLTPVGTGRNQAFCMPSFNKYAKNLFTAAGSNFRPASRAANCMFTPLQLQFASFLQ